MILIISSFFILLVTYVTLVKIIIDVDDTEEGENGDISNKMTVISID
jgi:hypothetical protein